METLIASYISKNDFTKELVQKHKYPIGHDNWEKKGNINVQFNIGYNEKNFYLIYWVRENYVKATHKKINEPVYEDSCVEFFISFDNVHYYNFEFNCIGNVLGQYGTGRNNRAFIEEDVLKEIVTEPSLGKNLIDIVDRKTNWSIAITIPKKIFNFSETEWENVNVIKCNFYKCGDKLAHPHYLSWSPVKTGSPDFHRMEYFGELKLAPKI